MKLPAMLDIDAAPPAMLLPEPLSFSLANDASKPWFLLWPLVVSPLCLLGSNADLPSFKPQCR